MYKSTGVLRYSVDERHDVGHKLHVEVDPGIAETYRALIPKNVRLNKPRYAPHISVIRSEFIQRLDLWGKYEGQAVLSPDLMLVRLELGLPSLSDLARPPDKASCFHMTLANLKTYKVSVTFDCYPARFKLEDGGDEEAV